jgi:hypothetical protein
MDEAVLVAEGFDLCELLVGGFILASSSAVAAV